MTAFNGRKATAQLRKMADDNETARKLFDYLAEYQLNQRETKVRVIRKSTGLSRRSLMDVFRELEELGLGKLVLGRKGYETRFCWAVPMISVGQAGIGELDELVIDDDAEDLDAEDSSDDPEMVIHQFQLRKGLVVQVELPEDLTDREAERLSKFFVSLPL